MKTRYGTSLENITVIAIQASGHSGNGTTGNVNDTGKKFTGNLVHIGNHEHQTLRRGECSAKETSSKSTVESTSSTGLRLINYTSYNIISYLHFGNHNTLTEYILKSFISPVIAVLTHTR